MNRFNGPPRGGFNRGPRSDFKREWHKAVCDQCKKECEVPFKPIKDKPVYCKECYAERKAA